LNDSPKRTVIVIPTFNERENVQRLIPALLRVAPPVSIVVVDDDSPDGTAEAVAKLAAAEKRVFLIRRPLRQGIGPAYKAGFAHAIESGADYILQMDADLSHPIESLPEMLRLIEGCDMVLGSRYLKGITVINWPIDRLLLSYFGNWYARRITGLPIRDVTGGFKCWRREVLERIRLERVRSNGYAFQVETTYRAWRMGFQIRETPIIFTDRTVGDSKMNKRIAIQAMWVVWWLRLMSALGRL
jgi:dolichol-phosphate mannosyltransferase